MVNNYIFDIDKTRGNDKQYRSCLNKRYDMNLIGYMEKHSQ